MFRIRRFAFRTKIFLMVLLVVLLFYGTQVQAVTMKSEQQKVDITYQEPQQTETPSVFWMVAQMLLALALIVALAWGLIRLLGKSMGLRMQGKWIRVLDEVSLGTNRGMVVVEIGGRSYLIGVTDHQIGMLTEIEDGQLIQEMVAASQDNGFERAGKAEIFLASVWNKLWPVKVVREREQSFDKVFNQRLRKLESMSGRLHAVDGSKDDGDRT